MRPNIQGAVAVVYIKIYRQAIYWSVATITSRCCFVGGLDIKKQSHTTVSAVRLLWVHTSCECACMHGCVGSVVYVYTTYVKLQTVKKNSHWSIPYTGIHPAVVAWW